jgi:flagellar basal-body rod protein FlgC
MSFENIMGIAGQAMDAQTVRINAAVSNIANADTQAGSAEDAFKAKRVIFKTILASEVNQNRGDTVGGVRVVQIARMSKSCLKWSISPLLQGLMKVLLRPVTQRNG